MKMKQIPYKILVKEIIRHIKDYIRDAVSISNHTQIYTNHFTRVVVLENRLENSHHLELISMSHMAETIDETRMPDKRKIDYITPVDLRQFAERKFHAYCLQKEKFGTTS